MRIVGWLALLVLLASCGTRNIGSPSPVDAAGPGSEVGNGGVYVHLLMDQGQLYGASLVGRLSPRPMPRKFRGSIAPEDWKWLGDNYDKLAKDISASRLVWVDRLPSTCGVDSCGCAPVPGVILLLESECRRSIFDRHAASVIVTHEAIHHFVGNDETKAKRLTSVVAAAWEALGHGDEAHWTPMRNLGFRTLYPQNVVWTGQELVFWTDWGTERYDPATNRWTLKEVWKEGEEPGKKPKDLRRKFVFAPEVLELQDSYPTEKMPESPRREFAFSPGVLAGHSIVVFEEDYDRGDRDVGYSYGRKVKFFGAVEPEPTLKHPGPSHFDDAGGVLDLQTNRWTPLPKQGAPAPRQYPFLLSAGDKMVVWGGQAQERTDGGIYDPATRRWDPIPDGPMPLRLRNESIAWADGKLVVWGGIDPSTPYLSDLKYFDIGWIYDPATHQWETMTNEGAPSPRALAQMVWAPEAGNALIVYGGYDDPNPGGYSAKATTRSGGIFDLSTRKWRAESHLRGGPVGEPQYPLDISSRRTNLRLVWDGVEVIAIGDGLAFYNPFDDTWEQADDHLRPFYLGESNDLFWTGLEMIFWNHETERGQLFYP